MAAMRSSIVENIWSKVITYGCSVHILNILFKDLEIFKENVFQVVKYFHNNHLACTKFKQACDKTSEQASGAK